MDLDLENHLNDLCLYVLLVRHYGTFVKVDRGGN